MKHTNSGPAFERVVVNEARRRHVPLARLAKTAGYRRIAMFRRCLRTGTCDTNQLERVADLLGLSLFGLARLGLTAEAAESTIEQVRMLAATIRGQARDIMGGAA